MQCALLLGALMLVLGASAAQAAISINDVEVNEANGPVGATFTVTRSANLFAPGANVAYATADGSAGAPGDYAPASGTLSFPSALFGGTQTQQVTITVQGDALDEAAETFRVLLSGAEVTKGEGLATIVDDDPQPTVGVLDAPAAAEGAVATFTIALSAPSGRAVSVGFATANGSAIAGQDYSARGGTIGIPAGATSASLGVPLLDDGADEPAENFELRIGAPSAAALGDASGVATILDTDEPATAPGGSPPPPPPPSPTSGKSAPASGSSTTPALPQLGISSPRLRRPATVLVTLSCPREAGRCSGRVTIFSRPNKRSKIEALRSERRLARRTFTLPGGGTQTLQLALSKRDKVLLRRTGRMNVRAYAVTEDGAGRTGVRRVNGTLIARTTHSG